MANNKFLANAFSLQMLKDFLCEIKVSEIAFEDVKLSTLISAVGHQDTANVLGVECNRINVSLEKVNLLLLQKRHQNTVQNAHVLCTTFPLKIILLQPQEMELNLKQLVFIGHNTLIIKL